MIIMALTDIHGDISRMNDHTLQQVKPDAILIAGDITNFGRKKEARQIIESIQKTNAQIYAVPGNCDHPEVGDFLNQEGLNIDRRIVVLNGIAFIGIGGSLPCPGKTPNELSEPDFESYLTKAARDLSPTIPKILLVHQPPFGTINDLSSSGNHVGSKSIRTFIERHKPLVCFSGHIHEGVGIDAIGDTKIVNPGPLRTGHYALARIVDNSVSVDIEAIG